MALVGLHTTVPTHCQSLSELTLKIKEPQGETQTAAQVKLHLFIRTVKHWAFYPAHHVEFPLVPQDDTMQTSATQHLSPMPAPLQAQGHIHRSYCNIEESSTGDQSFHRQPSWVVHLAHLIKQDTLQLLYVQTNRLQRLVALGSPVWGSVHQ